MPRANNRNIYKTNTIKYLIIENETDVFSLTFFKMPQIM